MKKKKILALILCAFLILSLCSCKAYVEHSTKYKDAMGEWVLNSIYVDTVPIKFEPTELKLEKHTLTLKVGEETKEGTVESENGEIEVSMDSTVTVYEFNVDEPADLLHLYADKEGKYYHYIFLSKDIYDEIQKDKQEKQQQIDQQREEIEKNEQKNKQEKEDKNEKDLTTEENKTE